MTRKNKIPKPYEVKISTLDKDGNVLESIVLEAIIGYSSTQRKQISARGKAKIMGIYRQINLFMTEKKPKQKS